MDALVGFIASLAAALAVLGLAYAKENKAFFWYKNLMEKSDNALSRFASFILAQQKASKRTAHENKIAKIAGIILNDISNIASYLEAISRKASLKLLTSSKKVKKAEPAKFIQDVYEHKKQIKKDLALQE